MVSRSIFFSAAIGWPRWTGSMSLLVYLSSGFQALVLLVDSVSPCSLAAAILSLIDTWAGCSISIWSMFPFSIPGAGGCWALGRKMSVGVVGVLSCCEGLSASSIGPSFFVAGDGEGGSWGESLGKAVAVVSSCVLSVRVLGADLADFCPSFRRDFVGAAVSASFSLPMFWGSAGSLFLLDLLLSRVSPFIMGGSVLSLEFGIVDDSLCESFYYMKDKD